MSVEAATFLLGQKRRRDVVSPQSRQRCMKPHSCQKILGRQFSTLPRPRFIEHAGSIAAASCPSPPGQQRRCHAAPLARNDGDGWNGSDTHHVLDDGAAAYCTWGCFRYFWFGTAPTFGNPRQNNPTGESLPIIGSRVKPLTQKDFCFTEFEIRLYDFPSRPTQRGVAQRTGAGRVAVDADGGADEGTGSGRAKSCCSDTPDVGVKLAVSPAGDGGNRAGLAGEITYKP